MLGRIYLAAFYNLLFMIGFAVAGDCCDSGQGCHSCPSCKHVCCELKAEPDEEEKSCWKVECKEICVPRVVFPWQNKHHKHHGQCCDSCDGHGACGPACDACRCNNGARVITVKVLKKHKYTCPSCKYSWTPVDMGCGDGCCDAGCASAPLMEMQPEPVVEPPKETDIPPAPPESSASISKRIRAIFSSRTKTK